MYTHPIQSEPARNVTAPANRGGAVAKRRTLLSKDLLCGQCEVHIEHAGETYSLRQTSKGKLILTK